MATSPQAAINAARTRLNNNWRELEAEVEEKIKSMKPIHPYVSVRGGLYTEEARNKVAAIYDQAGWNSNFSGYWMDFIPKEGSYE
jgi:hypothetical protein